MTAFSPLDTRMQPRVAILIDADNIHVSFRKEAEVKAAKLGTVISTHIFGNLMLQRDWAAETACAAHHCSNASGKNAADIELVIAALDLAYRKLAQTFVIVSNDRDFQPLIRHLRELGHEAVCLKSNHPPADPVPVAPVQAPKPPAAEATAKAYRQALDRLTSFIRSGADGKGRTLKEIGHHMGTVKAKTGKATWRAFVKANPSIFTLNVDQVSLR